MAHYVNKITSKVASIPGSWSRAEEPGNSDPPPYSEHGDAAQPAGTSLPSVPPHRPAMIAVMGPTGTGKSTFISKLAGRDMNIGHSLSSCMYPK